MSLQFARNRADELLSQLGITRAPIDVKAIAENVGLSVTEKPLDDISGLLITGHGRALVCVNSANSETRQRFTIAHEIAHYVLRHQSIEGEHVHVDKGNFISARNARASMGIDPIEVEANQFAATLLMPASMVRVAARQVAGDEPLFDQHVQTLAQRFNVSEQAMTIRLQTLGIL